MRERERVSEEKSKREDATRDYDGGRNSSSSSQCRVPACRGGEQAKQAKAIPTAMTANAAWARAAMCPGAEQQARRGRRCKMWLRIPLCVARPFLTGHGRCALAMPCPQPDPIYSESRRCKCAHPCITLRRYQAHVQPPTVPWPTPYTKGNKLTVQGLFSCLRRSC